MTPAEKHIRHYNSLKGKAVFKKELSQFHAAIKKDITSRRIDAHMPLGVECLDIEKSIGKALPLMNGKAMKINLVPIDVDKILKTQKINTKEAKADKKLSGDAAPAAKSVPTKKVETQSVVAHQARESNTGASKKVSHPKPIQPVTQQHAQPRSDKKLSGLVSADQLASLKFTEIPLEGEWKKELHQMFNDTQLMGWGAPGSGKTVKFLKFAQYLAQKGYKVLFLANEEYGRSTFSLKIKKFNIGHANLKFAKRLSEVNIQDYDVVILDSVNSLDMNLKQYVEFVESNSGRMFIPIVQCTKDGDFKGGKDWEHAVDIATEIKNRKFNPRKNRYDEEAEKKYNATVFEDRINEKEQKQKITDRVKERTQPEGLGRPLATFIPDTIV